MSLLDGIRVTIRIGVNEYIVLRILSSTRKSLQIFFERFSDALLDCHFGAFVLFLFLIPQAMLLTSLII
ncbi:MAG: hypothetical protein A2Z27_03265 [candidate division Zixibacteria bacterium RBG_16_50_21]|nr:MAG: hypothetical protein A2Z27_03265 [candidate division Zixibacteria bacterium RBG_16_50_21]